MGNDQARVMEMLKALNTKGKSPGGVNALVNMLGKMDRGTEKHILATLKQQNPQLAQELEDHFFSFEDLVTMDDAVLKRALAEVHRTTLALALKGTNETIRGKVLKNLSERAARMIEDDMELMGSKPKNLVEEAQREVTQTLRRWRNVIL